MLSSFAEKSIIPDYALALKTDSITPQILIAQQKEKSYIHGLQTWMKAWTLYLEILGFYHPHLWEQLVRYQGIIVRYSFEFSDFAWLKYDSLFRRTVALDSRVRWDVEHERLYNEGRNKMVRLRDPGSERPERTVTIAIQLGISRNCFKPKVDSATITQVARMQVRWAGENVKSTTGDYFATHGYVSSHRCSQVFSLWVRAPSGEVQKITL